MQKLLRWLSKNELFIILLVVAFFLRLPSLFEPYWYGDEGVYLTLGLGLKKGLLLYRDIFDNKPPLIYLLAAVANGNLFWFRLLLAVFGLGSVWLFFRLSQKLMAKKPPFAYLSTVIFTLLTTFRFLEGNVANAEMFILFPTLLGLNLVFDKKSFFLAGLILSAGFLLKIPAAFDFMALAVFLIFFSSSKKLLNIGKKELCLAGGYFLPIGLTALFFWLKGAWEIFFRSCFVQTFGYLSSWGTSSHRPSLLSLLKTDMGLRGLVLIIVLGLIWRYRRKLSSELSFATLWFVFSLFAATLSGRPYAHYLIQVVPPLALIIGLAFSHKKRANLFLAAGALFLLSLSFWRYRFWTYPTFSYYRNFISLVAGQKSKEAYFAYFDSRVPRIYQLAEFIVSATQPEDKIFIWGNEPYLYPMTKKLPTSSYTVAYHIIDLRAYRQIGQILEEERPAIIVVDRNLPRFSELNQVLKGYLNIQNFENLAVYRRRVY